jgi:hypothetical protein
VAALPGVVLLGYSAITRFAVFDHCAFMPTGRLRFGRELQANSLNESRRRLRMIDKRCGRDAPIDRNYGSPQPTSDVGMMRRRPAFSALIVRKGMPFPHVAASKIVALHQIVTVASKSPHPTPPPVNVTTVGGPQEIEPV